MHSTTPPANDFFPPFSHAEMRARRARVQAAMPARDLDCLLVWGAIGYGTSPGQINLSWFANYGAIGQAYLVVPPGGDATLMLGTIPHLRNARALTTGLDVRAGPVFFDEVIKRLEELKPRRIGVVGPYSSLGVTLPHEHRAALTQALPAAQLEDVTGWYEQFQITKSDEEIALLRRAGQLGDEIYAALLAATRPGVTDTELRRVIGRMCLEVGATHPFSHIGSFSTLDPEDCYPDFYPVQSAVRQGDVLQTELCVGWGNYWNKIWGTWFVGQPPDDYLRLHEAARRTHDRVIASIRPGVVCGELEHFATQLAADGLETHVPLVMGWSTLNHGPLAATVPGTRWHDRAKRYRDWAFAPGQTLTIVSWLSLPSTKRGSGWAPAALFQKTVLSDSTRIWEPVFTWFPATGCRPDRPARWRGAPATPCRPTPSAEAGPDESRPGCAAGNTGPCRRGRRRPPVPAATDRR